MPSIYDHKIPAKKRLTLSSHTALIVTTTPPYNKASTDTIARWIKETLGQAGIDTSKYKPHSCRHASTSAAKHHGVSIRTILKSACWARESTFKNFYLKDIEERYEVNTKNFGTSFIDNIR